MAARAIPTALRISMGAPTARLSSPRTSRHSLLCCTSNIRRLATRRRMLSLLRRGTGWHLSAFDWIERYVPGGQTRSLGRYLDSACRGINGLETTEQSALNLVYQFGFGAWDDARRARRARRFQAFTGRCEGRRRSWAGMSDYHRRLPTVCRRAVSPEPPADRARPLAKRLR